MELMATSLDKFYKFVYCSLNDVIPEEILGKITLAVSVPTVLSSVSGCAGEPELTASLCFPDCEGSQPLKGKLENNPPW